LISLEKAYHIADAANVVKFVSWSSFSTPPETLKLDVTGRLRPRVKSSEAPWPGVSVGSQTPGRELT
jgi:hypothetical protein